MAFKDLEKTPIKDFIFHQKTRYFLYTLLPIFILKVLGYGLTEITTRYFNRVPSKDYLPASEIPWFIRQFPSENASDLAVWYDKAFQEISKEWRHSSNLVRKAQDDQIWIPLNAKDSMALEKAWRKNRKCSKKKVETTCDSPGFQAMMKQEKIHVMNGAYYAFLKDNHGYLSPYYWKNERERWLLIRGEWIYEVPEPPPVLYFMEIKGEPKQKSYYQPVPLGAIASLNAYSGDLKLFNGRPTKFNDFEATYSHLVFVVHGIGHHKGEEDIVQNGYDVRKGFAQYIKKFHSDFETELPMVIPVAWRYNLSLNDAMILDTPMLKFPFGKELGLIFNDIFYYIKGYKNVIEDTLISELKAQYSKFLIRHPSFSQNGKVSILAHSLGSVIAFEILQYKSNQLPFNVHNVFLIGSPLARFKASESAENIAQLRKNQWIANGHFFNILHSLDPVAHRLEVLFNEEYKYVEPSELYLYNDFRRHFCNELDISGLEKAEIQAFYNRVNCDRNLGKNHDAFWQFESVTYDYAMAAHQDNNDSVKAQISQQFSKNNVKRIPWNNRTTIKAISPQKTIPHRLDFDISKTEYTGLKHLEGSIEKKFAGWAKELLPAHMSYWNRPEVIALMTNVMYELDRDYSDCNETDSPYLSRFQQVTWWQGARQWCTMKTLRWLGVFVLLGAVTLSVLIVYDEPGDTLPRNICIALSVVFTFTWLLWNYISPHFPFHEVLWVFWTCFYRICQVAATIVLGIYGWERSEANLPLFWGTLSTCVFFLGGIVTFLFPPTLLGLIISNASLTVIPLTYILIQKFTQIKPQLFQDRQNGCFSILASFSLGNFIVWLYPPSLKYFIYTGFISITITAIIFPLLTRKVIQISSCFAITIGIWFLTDPDVIGRIAILFDAPDLYVYGIYLFIFILPILNLLLTENHLNLDAAFRFIYNLMLALLILTAVKVAYIKLAEFSQDYELDCRNPIEKGRCLEYVLYDTKTKTSGPAKSVLPSFLSDLLNPLSAVAGNIWKHFQ